MVIDRFGYDHNSLIVELASNDGYLLQYFIEKDVPVLGIEPAKNVAEAAIESGVARRQLDLEHYRQQLYVRAEEMRKR